MMTTSDVRTQFFSLPPGESFALRSGGTLPGLTVAYETYGELSPAKDNAILVFHAMTGSQHAAGFNPAVAGIGSLWTEECHQGWWDEFIGPGKALDTQRFFVLCANYLGGCYGSTGPASLHPDTGRQFGSAFPRITIADMVDAQLRLADHLGIHRFHAVVGSSIGGMMALTLATLHPDRVRIVIPIGSGMEVTPLQRIINFEQACAIEGDPDFLGGDYYDSARRPEAGLARARMIAHKTFVSLRALEDRARDEILEPAAGFSWYHLNSTLESYMLHQGRKFVRRFDANTYLRVLDAWQQFDLRAAAGEDTWDGLFARCADQQFLMFTIDSDVSFYPEEQEALACALKAAGIRHMRITVHSEKGHDSFLLEPDLYTPHLAFILGK